MNLSKKENEDDTTFASIVNREFDKFRLSEITPGMFKCLIFVSKNAELRLRLLTKLEQDQKITLQNLADESQHILNLRADTVKIEEQDISHIHAVQNKPKGWKKKLLKLIPVLVEANYIYLKILLLKSVKIVGTKNINFSTVEKSPKVKQKIEILLVLLNKKQSRQ